MSAKAGDARAAIENALSEFKRADVQPEQIGKLAEKLLGNWWIARACTELPSAQIKGTDEALKQLAEFEDLAARLLKSRKGMCAEASAAIMEADATFYERRTLTIQDRLEELTSIAASARRAMAERAATEPVPAKNGRPVQHAPLNLSKLLADYYHSLTGEEPTKSNGYAQLLGRLFDVLDVKIFKKNGDPQKANATTYAAQGAEHWRKKRGKLVHRWL